MEDESTTDPFGPPPAAFPQVGGDGPWEKPEEGELKAVERDLDSRVDYALRQLNALGAPDGQHLERIEHEKAVREDLYGRLPTESMPGHRTADLASATGYSWAEVELALRQMAVEHQVVQVEDRWTSTLPF